MSNDPYYGSPTPDHTAAQPAETGLPSVGSNASRLSPEEIATLPMQALLVRTGMLTIDQLSDALRENISTGRPVEDIAVARGWVPAEEVARLTAAKQGLTYVPVAPPPPEPAPEPVAPPPAPQPYEAVAPPPPVAPAPAPAPAPVAPAPEPVVAPPPPIVQTGNETGSVGVFLNLVDGERLWIGRFTSVEAGETHAAEIIDALMRPEPGIWPRFGNRLVRPGSVVAVEVSRRRDD